MLESIGRRESYLALLLEYPAALHRLAALVAASPWAADYLARHPILLDELISPGAIAEVPDWPALGARLAAELDEAADNMERQMELLRHFKQVQTLRLLTQDLAGTLPLETLSDHLSDLACLILEQVLRLAWDRLRTRHRADPLFAVVGYGKLGGKELGYASDLDLIFLYDDEHPEAPENYARLAQRINTWLTSFTPAGVLYETDLRLRPDGASGLLVSRLDAFAEYQRTKAWVFEHQALTRARFVAGEADIGARFEQLRVEILRLPRELDALREEVRGHARAHAGGSSQHAAGCSTSSTTAAASSTSSSSSSTWCSGTLIATASSPATSAIWRCCGWPAALGLIRDEAAQAVHHSYREFRRMQHALRLQGEALRAGRAGEGGRTGGAGAGAVGRCSERIGTRI